jgi:hypothetical protein
MFLGVSIDEMNLGSVGYGLLIGWVLWFLMLVASIEIFDYMNNKNKKTSIFLSLTIPRPLHSKDSLQQLHCVVTFYSNKCGNQY